MWKHSVVTRVLPALAALVLVACEDGSITGPASPEVARWGQSEQAPEPAEELRVLTWNIYVGGALESAFQGDGSVPFPLLVAQLWGQIQNTRFPERAEAIADQIEAFEPHVVGLQEVSEFRIQSPGDFLTGVFQPNAPPSDVVLDQLATLQAALAARGLDYSVAVKSDNFDIEVPMVTGTGGFDDIRLIDSDVLLVRSDVTVEDAAAFAFDENFQLSLEGIPLTIRRGFGVVDLTVGRREYRVVVTHLEPGDEGGEAIQTAQADQILGEVTGSSVPVLLLGDLNTGPHATSTATYGNLLATGFADLWTVGHPRGEGPTCCFEKDLLLAEPGLDRRLDHVLYRDALTLQGVPFRGRVRAERVGEMSADRTLPTGLWPSDHAGVFVSLTPAPTTSPITAR